MTRRAAGLQPRRGVVAAGIACAVLLGGCSSVPPPRFHTLLPAPAAPSTHSVAAGPLAWEVLQVAVPAQVDQPQWVVRAVDGSLAVLEQERWIAPLGEEIRAAVAARLTQVVGAPAATADPGKLWRVRIDVQRFDSVPGSEARLDAIWTVGLVADPSGALRCRGEFAQPVTTAGYLALAKGHQQGAARLADAVAGALKSMSSGQKGSCG